MAAAAENVQQPSEVVALVHGIRTQATWAERVKRVLDRPPLLVAKPIRYGYFDLVRFFLPGPTRARPIRRVTRELRSLRTRYPTSRISVVAHSFGTYAIARILAEEADIHVHRLILCGSIVPSEYRWDLAASRIATETVNECGSRDIWPLLATACTWGYGPSGTFGFGSAYVTDRFHDFRHSDFFSEDFAQKYWLPLFSDGQVVDSSFNRPTPPSWQNLLPRLPLRWTAAPLLAAAVASFVLPVLPQRRDRAEIITEQRDQASAGLRGLRPGRVAIFVQDGDPEAFGVAQQLRAVFLKASWTSSDLLPINTCPFGVSVKQEPGADVPQVRAALSMSGLLVQALDDPNGALDWPESAAALKICVGAKPQ